MSDVGACSIDGVVLTGEHRSTRKKRMFYCHFITLLD